MTSHDRFVRCARWLRLSPVAGNENTTTAKPIHQDELQRLVAHGDGDGETHSLLT